MSRTPSSVRLLASFHPLIIINPQFENFRSHGLPVGLNEGDHMGSFEVAQLCGIRAKFETRSATFENPAQLSGAQRNFVIAACNSRDGERNSFSLLDVMIDLQHPSSPWKARHGVKRCKYDPLKEQ
ncbi:hypothetical protein FA13DRAFT_1709430 [Coprinellus micaceus]|uniref:Uncharacterized protein n=1 Tax=Coprinellus micaceus TaxID=71717 RepID=A0A4Y7TDF1_COPMI|nr:hypothetical protein FA13DRAFT_1709430 [Coprinellus micaceus]